MIWAPLAALTGELDAAVHAVEEAMPVIQKSFPPAALDVWKADVGASNTMQRAGKFAAAEQFARDSLASARAGKFGPGDARLGNSWQALGEALLAEKRYADAGEAFGKPRRSIAPPAKAGRKGHRRWSSAGRKPPAGSKGTHADFPAASQVAQIWAREPSFTVLSVTSAASYNWPESCSPESENRHVQDVDETRRPGLPGAGVLALGTGYHPVEAHPQGCRRTWR